eukprot:6210230-Pleurochrysis_carterae.AAC.2
MQRVLLEIVHQPKRVAIDVPPSAEHARGGAAVAPRHEARVWTVGEGYVPRKVNVRTRVTREVQQTSLAKPVTWSRSSSCRAATGHLERSAVLPYEPRKSSGCDGAIR